MRWPFRTIITLCCLQITSKLSVGKQWPFCCAQCFSELGWWLWLSRAGSRLCLVIAEVSAEGLECPRETWSLGFFIHTGCSHNMDGIETAVAGRLRWMEVLIRVSMQVTRLGGLSFLPAWQLPSSLTSHIEAQAPKTCAAMTQDNS